MIKKIFRKTFKTALQALAALAVGITGSHAAQIYMDSDTFLKTTTGQASSLPAASKCAFTKGQSFEVKSIVDGGASHWQVVLPRAYTGCTLTTGYIYQPHVATESTTVSVKIATVFKKTTASASTLPATSKCDMPTGVYPLSGGITSSAAHFGVNLKALLPNCAFSQGFVYDGHASAGVAQISLSSPATLKKTTAAATTLPATDKCDIPKANYVLVSGAIRSNGGSGTHYSVDMVTAPAGCGFKTGFISYEPTYLAGPAFNPANYTIPLANGIAGPGDQSWCACRNVGTSPHIGQDWNADGPENSVALSDGAIVDKTFSATCGHTLTVRDSGGADFIYRHLDANAFQIGQAVTKGVLLGSHSAYPTSSCGTGPHLHFERRSAGVFNDSEVFKTCQFGLSSCNFDPNSPFKPQTTLLKAAPVSATAVRASSVENMTATNEITARSSCRINPAQYGEVASNTLASYRAAPSNLNVVSEASKRGGQSVVSVAATLSNNTANQCGKGQSCLTSMSVLAETSNGKLVRLFHDATIRNRTAAVIADESFCLPANATGRGFLLMTDQTGARYQQEVKL